MNTETALKSRATIIKVPDASPGLLVAEGRQIPFVLDQVWRSAVAPAINLAVNIEKDSSDKVTGIWIVDPHQLAKESLSYFSEAAQRRAREAAFLATRGSGGLMARIGKFTLAVIGLLWVAFFWMPAVKINAGFFAKSFSLWQVLGVDLENGNLQSHGMFSVIGIAALLAPLVASYRGTAQGRYWNAAPLAYLIAAGFRISSMLGNAVGSVREARAADMFSIEAGGYLLVIASAVLATRAFSIRDRA